MFSSLFSSQPWLNRKDFSDFELLLFALGCIGWVIAYIGVALTLRRKQYVEIPAGAVAANIAWEFVWGFLFGSNMGRVFTVGYAVWCLQDVYITWNTFRFGGAQVDNAQLRRWFKPLFAFAIVAWGFAIYWFVKDGFDTGYGAVSGYILNVMMSALYITLLLKGDVRDFTPLVAWSKMLGTLLLSIFNVMVRGEDLFLMSLCGITLALDVAYIALLHSRRAAATAPVSHASLQVAA